MMDVYVTHYRLPVCIAAVELHWRSFFSSLTVFLPPSIVFHFNDDSFLCYISMYVLLLKVMFLCDYRAGC